MDFKKIRDKHKLSQEKFARLLGVTLSTVNRWEKGFGKPSPLALEKLKALEEQQ